MTRTAVRQEEQVQPSETYTDNIVPSLANFETNTAHAEDDFNNVRSQLHNLMKVQTGNWYDDLAVPATFTGEGEAKRGVDNLNSDLHELERKRILKRRPLVGVDVAAGAGPGVTVTVLGAGDLPANTTAAVGAVTTRGTVVAQATTFTTASASDVVAGGNALQPKNLCKITDATTGDPILDTSGREVYGLLQSENGTDGHTITATTPNRVQLSYVVRNATNDGLVLIADNAMDGKTFDYAPIERYAFDDIPEEAWLGDDYVDAGAANVTRQAAYDNQGTAPVDLTNAATLDLEGAGLAWTVRDDLEAILFQIIEGSAGGTSEIAFGSDVDTFDNDAVLNDFNSPLRVDTGNVDIHIGVTAGHVETVNASDDLSIQSAREIFFDDVNQVGSTWAQTDGIKLSETTAEWDAFETAFGEVSLLNAIVQAQSGVARDKCVAVVTSNIAPNTLIEGPGGPGTANIDADLCDYDTLTFVDDVDVYINGVLQRNGANAAANHDVYPSAVSAERQVGAFFCEFRLRFRGGTRPDVITMITWG